MDTQLLKSETQEKHLIMKAKVKTYDCVKEIRKSRERMSRDLRGKSTEQILVYFKKRQEERKTTGNNVSYEN